MKRFVNNDERLYNMTKWACTFLCILTDYKSITKLLPIGNKKLQGCNKYLSLRPDATGSGHVPVCMLYMPYIIYNHLKELRFG